MLYGEKFAEIIPRIKTRLQVVALLAGLAAFLVIRSLDTQNLQAQIAAIAAALIVIVFAQIVDAMKLLPTRERSRAFLAVLIATALLVILMIVIAASSLTGTQLDLAKVQGTGWIFLGYFNTGESRFIEGPYFERSDRTNNPDHPVPSIGDIIETTHRREIIIVDYINRDLDLIYQPPLRNLAKRDRTGVMLPPGTRLLIKDLSRARKPGRPQAIWARIELEQ